MQNLMAMVHSRSVQEPDFLFLKSAKTPNSFSFQKGKCAGREEEGRKRSATYK